MEPRRRENGDYTECAAHKPLRVTMFVLQGAMTSIEHDIA